MSGGEDVPLFEVPASEVQAKLARLEAHAALVVNGHLWRVTFVNPIKFDAALQRAVPLGPVGQGMSALKQLPDLKRARQVAKDWREALGA